MELNEIHTEHEHASLNLKVLLLIFAVVLIAALGYLVARQSQANSGSATDLTQSPTKAYKTVKLINDYPGLVPTPANLTMEVPTTWSVWRALGAVPSSVIAPDDTSPEPNKLLSLAPIYVEGDTGYRDINQASQVDFYVSFSDMAASEIAKAKAADKDAVWTTQTISGIKVDVESLPSSNGKIENGLRGDRNYYISLPHELKGAPMIDFALGRIEYIKIHKQAIGNAAFESDFKHLIASLEFTK